MSAHPQGHGLDHGPHAGRGGREGTVVAVCTSAVRGVQKRSVAEAELVADHGIRGDAHAGDWHRQVSLLADEAAERMRAKGLAIAAGDFGENILTRGVDLLAVPVGGRIRLGAPLAGGGAGNSEGGVLLEVTQIGKVCHDPCAIYAQAGECIMPTQGIFCRVVHGGTVKPGDGIEIADSTTAGPRPATGGPAEGNRDVVSDGGSDPE